MTWANLFAPAARLGEDRVMSRLATMLLCLALSACSADRVLIELAHPPGFDPALQEGTLEVALFDVGRGALVSRSTVQLSALGGEASLAEGLELDEGTTYRLIVAGELTSAACAAEKDRLTGRSPPFQHRAGDARVQVYVDCAGRSSATSAAPVVGGFFRSATRLEGPTSYGQVLLVGGMQLKNPADISDLTRGEVNDSLEIFDVQQNRFRLLEAKLSRSRVWHQATAVGDGRVLVSGGATLVEVSKVKRFAALDLVELISNERVTGLSAMKVARYGHSALQLEGRLLIAGGSINSLQLVTNGAELYDVESGQSLGPVSNMSARRNYAMAAPVGSKGDALISGGRWLNGLKVGDERFCLQGNDCSCEAPCFEPIEGFPVGEGRFQGAAVSVGCDDGSGAVYVIGGRHDKLEDKQIPARTYGDIYCYDLQDPKRTRRVGSLLTPRSLHTASLIDPGPGGSERRIFVAGGVDDQGTLRGDAELFTAPCRCPAQIDPPSRVGLASVRYAHTATVLADGSVLLVGGLLAESTAERFVPTF
jgi:hypothetical protein